MEESQSILTVCLTNFTAKSLPPTGEQGQVRGPLHPVHGRLQPLPGRLEAGPVGRPDEPVHGVRGLLRDLQPDGEGRQGGERKVAAQRQVEDDRYRVNHQVRTNLQLT